MSGSEDPDKQDTEGIQGGKRIASHHHILIGFFFPFSTMFVPCEQFTTQYHF